MVFNSVAEKNVYETMQTGLYKSATLEMFDIIDKLQITDKTYDTLQYVEEALLQHLSDLKKLEEEYPGLLNKYLIAIKSGDIIDNQRMEQENSFLLGLYSQIATGNAIDKMIGFEKESKKITKEDIDSVVLTLLQGTSSENDRIIRTSNEKYVGHMEGDQFVVSYFPIDYQQAGIALEKLAEIYNTSLPAEVYNNILVQPFLLHGLFGAIQAYGDGNTRMGRLFQHLLIWKLIKEKSDFSFDMPPLFITRTYQPYRDKYRMLISELVKQNDNDIWNEWFMFNFRRVEDQLYKSEENILALKKRNPIKNTDII